MQTCIWPTWCHCHSLSLAPVKSRLVLPFWYRLTQVVLEKRPLNGCSISELRSTEINSVTSKYSGHELIIHYVPTVEEIHPNNHLGAGRWNIAGSVGLEAGFLLRLFLASERRIVVVIVNLAVATFQRTFVRRPTFTARIIGIGKRFWSSRREKRLCLPGARRAVCCSRTDTTRPRQSNKQNRSVTTWAEGPKRTVAGWKNC